ncbi:unnamed protein product [Cylicostephanus goldi]|uniref:Uncharacterized protein n=1 Tax=Cylicostephanus goldi TaxID=71465 RepID=A0A3P6SGZ0_CYLGO|nr:unnamed protein product [Cylicostephanus goldi]
MDLKEERTKIKKDEVSKFALLNKKTLGLLQITDKTPVKDRCIFKLACEPPMVKAIESFRSRYPSWEVTTAFLLQRLGLQYNSAKDGKWPLAGSEGEESDVSKSDSEESEKETPLKALPKTQPKKDLTKDSLFEMPSRAGPTKQLKRKKAPREVGDGFEHTKEDEGDAKKPASDKDYEQMVESSSEKSSPVKAKALKKRKSLPSQSSAAETTVVRKKKEKRKSLPLKSSADKPTVLKKKKSIIGTHSEAKSGEASTTAPEPHKLVS